MRVINDPVHGLVVIPNYALWAFQTELFQRLRRVKQLGNLSEAWPSAVHTRLEHSLGAMHLAHEYSKILGFPEHLARPFILASLLHDIAHGPYSHTFERVIGGTPLQEVYVDHDHFRIVLLEKHPEMISAMSESDRSNILAIWGHGDGDGLAQSEISCLRALLEGLAGVDRMDYILRDSYHTTPRRRLDRTCIQAIMMETRVDLDEGFVFYSKKGEHCIRNFLEERTYMYKEVYWHRRAVAADEFLAHALKEHLDAIKTVLTVEYFACLDDGFVNSLAWTENGYPLRMFLAGRIPQLEELKVGEDPPKGSEGVIRLVTYGCTQSDIRGVRLSMEISDYIVVKKFRLANIVLHAEM